MYIIVHLTEGVLVRVADLLSEHPLQLRLHTPSTRERLARTVTGCAPTELMDPTPYLEPDCLLLTSGIALNVHESRTWDAYVERLAQVPVAAIAFATGMAHRMLPPELVTACNAHEVPLLEVPSVVPPLQVDRHVEDVLQAERLQVVNRGWHLADECARLANQGAEVATLLAAIYESVQSPVAVFDAFGSVIAQYPELVTWPDGGGQKSRTALNIPLPMGLNRACRLAVMRLGTGPQLEAMLTPVASILALQLNRSVVVDATRHQEIRQLVRDCAAWSEATRSDVARAFDALGLDRREETAILIADLSGEHQSASWQLRLALHDLFETVRATEIESKLYAFLQGPRQSFPEVTDRLFAIDPGQPLILKEPAPTIDEFRVSVVHAQDLLRHVERPTLAPGLGLSAIVSATAGRGAREAAVRLLDPIVEHDRNKNAGLVATLRAYLRNDAQPGRTCEDLFIHRNSLNYRLRKIEGLLRTPLDTVEGQATCLLALRLVDLEPY
ncbi:PucR family transcriptional regulator [Leucobacter sp. M11]|uniref:PucR family transcriptional regulator n=1 Tax=Leucobacter sp. M11 TaxID=2993565 RepID=UPI002D7F0AF0|nr:PucR family transcriptional regulator [Leucobacter sp. M11]